MPLKFPKGNNWKDSLGSRSWHCWPFLFNKVKPFFFVCSVDFQSSLSLYMTCDIHFAKFQNMGVFPPFKVGTISRLCSVFFFFLMWRVGVVCWSWKDYWYYKRTCALSYVFIMVANVFRFINIFSPRPNAYRWG